MNKVRKQVIEGNEISQIYTFELGGVPQKVLIEGKTRKLPVVIFLHGGPGQPFPFSVGTRGMFPEFTDRFIVVSWDQLGCGINDCKHMDDFCLADFVQMTNDLITEVKNKFPENRIILFGVSWGSILACKCSQNSDAVVVWGQALHNLFLNDIVYDELEKSELPKEKLEKIKALTLDTLTKKELMLISKSIMKYTDGYNNKKEKKSPMGPIIRGLLASPDYRLKDIKAMMVNGTSSSTNLWLEMVKINLVEELSNTQVPYYLLQGDTDIVTTTEYVIHTVEAAHNKKLHLIIIDNSGHIPGAEGMQAVLETLISATE